ADEEVYPKRKPNADWPLKLCPFRGRRHEGAVFPPGQARRAVGNSIVRRRLGLVRRVAVRTRGVQAVRFVHRQAGLASLVLAGACFALGSAGCGDPSGVGTTVPVVGKVTADGQPVKAGTVSFRPDKSKGNTTVHEPFGEIDSQGNYKLFTGKKEGAPV